MARRPAITRPGPRVSESLMHDVGKIDRSLADRLTPPSDRLPGILILVAAAAYSRARRSAAA